MGDASASPLRIMKSFPWFKRIASAGRPQQHSISDSRARDVGAGSFGHVLTTSGRCFPQHDADRCASKAEIGRTSPSGTVPVADLTPAPTRPTRPAPARSLPLPGAARAEPAARFSPPTPAAHGPGGRPCSPPGARGCGGSPRTGPWR